MLTNAAVKAARPRAVAYKLSDGRELSLHVFPTGLRSWRWRFTWSGKDQTLTIGSYPEVSLDQARAAADVARARLAGGEDPRTPASTSSAEPRTFEPAALAWIEKKRASWTPVHADGVLAALKLHIFPAIGAKRLDAIEPPDVLEAIEAIEQRGSKATAHKVRHWVDCVFKLACAKHWARTNPAAGIEEAMTAPDTVRHHAALESIGELRELLAAASRVKTGPGPQLALRFLALTAPRFACVRFADWKEIEDLDGSAPLWRIPAAHIKLKAADKLEVANDHLVPLSPAAVAVLREARAHTQEGLIFRGRGGQKAIGEKALEPLHIAAGYKDRHVTHGWRASFSTILNERHPDQRAAIDRALAHVGGKDDKAEGINRQVEGAYNRATHLPQRRALFEAWAHLLVGDRARGDVRD